MKPLKLTLATLLLMTAHIQAADLPAPDAERKPHEVKAPHGAVRNDEYYWLRDDKRQDKAVIAYLNAENAYTSQVMAPLKPLEDKLYGEIVARMVADVSYQSRTPYFWQACDGLGGKETWRNVGLNSDGKGQPPQVNAMSHGCPPTRFRQINV